MKIAVVEGEMATLGYKDAAKEPGRKPVVCVAGLACNALEARYGENQMYEASYCSIKALASDPRRTLEGLQLQLSEGTLKDGRVVPCTADASGVKQRPVYGTAGISSLNPGEPAGVTIWKGFID